MGRRSILSPAVAMRRPPCSLMREAAAIAMGRIDEFDGRGGLGVALPRAGVEVLYAGRVREPPQGTARETFEAVKMRKAAAPTNAS